MQTLTIATRQSALALWQATFIQEQILRHYPDCAVKILPLSTRGDQILDRTLSKIGGKGLFVKELEEALWDGRADLAVHSMKDVPMQLPEGFMIAAVSAREEPLDAWVSNNHASIEGLPENARVGTASLRREAQLRARKAVVVQPLRGNLQTRLRKLDEGQFEGIILAAAGLKRLGLESRIRQIIPAEDSLPAAGQGALGIEILAARTDLRDFLAPLHDATTGHCVSAERALARALQGSCQVPLAAYATEDSGQLLLRGLVAHPDGSLVLQESARAPVAYADSLGRAVAKKLAQAGAQTLIDDVLRKA